MTDVMITGIFGHSRNPSSGVTSGRCCVGVLPTGKFDSNPPVSGVPYKEYSVPSASGSFTRFGSRFDDTTYYG